MRYSLILLIIFLSFLSSINNAYSITFAEDGENPDKLFPRAINWVIAECTNVKKIIEDKSPTYIVSDFEIRKSLNGYLKERDQITTRHIAGMSTFPAFSVGNSYLLLLNDTNSQGFFVFAGFTAVTPLIKGKEFLKGRDPSKWKDIKKDGLYVPKEYLKRLPESFREKIKENSSIENLIDLIREFKLKIENNNKDN